MSDATELQRLRRPTRRLSYHLRDLQGIPQRYGRAKAKQTPEARDRGLPHTAISQEEEKEEEEK